MFVPQWIRRNKLVQTKAMAAEIQGAEEGASKNELAREDDKGEQHEQERQQEETHDAHDTTVFGQAMGIDQADLLDLNPDIHALFCYYNHIYFQDKLQACTVDWSTGRMTLCAGICKYDLGGGCAIRLSEPLLKYRTSKEVKETLLHEMIHAYLWLTNKNDNHDDHGPSFQGLMHDINRSTILDHQRPERGYNIDIYHKFTSEVENYQCHHWKCKLCGDLIKRAMNREPSPLDCILKGAGRDFCQNDRCHWHTHEKQCGGKYDKVAEPEGYIDRRKRSGKQLRKAFSAGTKKLVGVKKSMATDIKEDVDCQLTSNNQVLRKTSLENFFRKGFLIPEEKVELVSQMKDCKSDLSDSLSEEMGGRKKKKMRSLNMNKGIEDEAPMEASDGDFRCGSDKEIGFCDELLMNDCTVIIGWKGWCGFEADEHEAGMKPLENKRSRRWCRVGRFCQTQAVKEVERDLDETDVQAIHRLEERGGNCAEKIEIDLEIMNVKGNVAVPHCRHLNTCQQYMNGVFVFSEGCFCHKEANENGIFCVDDDNCTNGTKKINNGEGSGKPSMSDIYDENCERFKDSISISKYIGVGQEVHEEKVAEDKLQCQGRVKRSRDQKSQTQCDNAIAPAQRERVLGPSAICPICGECSYGDIQDANFNTLFNDHIDSCMQGTS